jgi:hypothetical protein
MQSKEKDKRNIKFLNEKEEAVSLEIASSFEYKSCAGYFFTFDHSN